MNAKQSADNRIILNRDVAGHGDAIRHDHMVADMPVMRDMRIGHHQAIVAHARDAAALRRAAIDGHVFAERVQSPITTRVSSPAYFKSCGGEPITTPV